MKKYQNRFIICRYRNGIITKSENLFIFQSSVSIDIKIKVDEGYLLVFIRLMKKSIIKTHSSRKIIFFRFLFISKIQNEKKNYFNHYRLFLLLKQIFFFMFIVTCFTYLSFRSFIAAIILFLFLHGEQNNQWSCLSNTFHLVICYILQSFTLTNNKLKDNRYIQRFISAQ